MKKLLLLFAFVFLTFFAQSQTLKGFTIGSTFNGETTINPNNNWPQAIINTTLGGVEGELELMLGKNNVIMGIMFTSNEQSSTIAIDHIVNGFKEKFNVNFEEDENGWYISVKDGSYMMIRLTDDEKAFASIINYEMVRNTLKDDMNLDNDDF